MADNDKSSPMSQTSFAPDKPPAYTVSPPAQPTYPPQPVYPPQPTYPPPPGGYGPLLIGTAVIPTMVPMVIAPQLGPKPTPITCRSCNQEIVTRVEMRIATKTHLFAALLCLIGCFPCACIPYCIDSCKNADHYCPNCSVYIGSYQR